VAHFTPFLIFPTAVAACHHAGGDQINSTNGSEWEGEDGELAQTENVARIAPALGRRYPIPLDLGHGAKGRGWCAGYPFDGMRRQFDTTFRFFPSSASGSNRIKTFVCCLHIFVWLSLLTALRLLVLCLICSRHAGSLNSAGLLSVKYFSSPSPSLVINCSWPQILQGTYHSPPTVIVHLFWSSMNDTSGFIMWYCR